ncbi:MAG: alanine racemase, partial [Ilumatobacteraceae bacterium]
MTSALAQDIGHDEARPVSAEIDLDAITHNVELIRARAGRAVKLLVPVKANAYGHGVVEVSRHLQQLGVDGLATANVDDAVAARRGGVTLPFLLYGAQLPGGNRYLLEHGLTPTVYDHAGLQAIAAAGSPSHPINVHVKV